MLQPARTNAPAISVSCDFFQNRWLCIRLPCCRSKNRFLVLLRRQFSGATLACMRAYFLKSPEMELELRDAPQPQPKPGQHLVRVRAAGLNRGEFLRHGLTKPGAPKIGGTEGAGEVEGTGARVMGRLPSSFAEYALMDAADAIPVPQTLSWEEAAATPLTFLVVYDMLVQQGNLKQDEWLLVTAASSGVGVAALLAAKALGAKVIGTSGSEEKLKKLLPRSEEHLNSSHSQ